jgi:hypothetical protein
MARRKISTRPKTAIIAGAALLIALGCFWPPPPYKWICAPPIKRAAANGVSASAAFGAYGYVGDHFQISEPRWLNAFRVEVDVFHDGGPKAGWGTTFVLELTLTGWQIVAEEDSYVV